MESVDEIAAKIAALGPAYTEYVQRVCDNAVDGEMIAPSLSPKVRWMSSSPS